MTCKRGDRHSARRGDRHRDSADRRADRHEKTSARHADRHHNSADRHRKTSVRPADRHRDRHANEHFTADDVDLLPSAPPRFVHGFLSSVALATDVGDDVATLTVTCCVSRRGTDEGIRRVRTEFAPRTSGADFEMARAVVVGTVPSVVHLPRARTRRFFSVSVPTPALPSDRTTFPTCFDLSSSQRRRAAGRPTGPGSVWAPLPPPAPASPQAAPQDAPIVSAIIDSAFAAASREARSTNETSESDDDEPSSSYFRVKDPDERLATDSNYDAETRRKLDRLGQGRARRVEAGELCKEWAGKKSNKKGPMWRNVNNRRRIFESALAHFEAFGVNTICNGDAKEIKKLRNMRDRQAAADRMDHSSNEEYFRAMYFCVLLLYTRYRSFNESIACFKGKSTMSKRELLAKTDEFLVGSSEPLVSILQTHERRCVHAWNDPFRYVAQHGGLYKLLQKRDRFRAGKKGHRDRFMSGSQEDKLTDRECEHIRAWGARALPDRIQPLPLYEGCNFWKFGTQFPNKYPPVPSIRLSWSDETKDFFVGRYLHYSRMRQVRFEDKHIYLGGKYIEIGSTEYKHALEMQRRREQLRKAQRSKTSATYFATGGGWWKKKHREEPWPMF